MNQALVLEQNLEIHAVSWQNESVSVCNVPVNTELDTIQKKVFCVLGYQKLCTLILCSDFPCKPV